VSTAIEWADATWNPVTGCDRVSAGCDNCYAMALAKRLKAMGSPKYQRDGDPAASGPGFGLTTHEAALAVPFGWARPRRVFVNSMSDLFHPRVPGEFIARVFAVMAMAKQHTFQVLTKRPARMRAFLTDQCRCGCGHAPGAHLRSQMSWAGAPHSPTYVDGVVAREVGERPWPLPNVWLGASVEDQRWAGVRVPALLGTPAAVRFVSCEPLLGPVDLSAWLELGLHWVIVGGESGPGARPTHPGWARGLRDQCLAAGVPFFFKQWGEWGPAPWRVPMRNPAAGDAELAVAKAKAEAEQARATHVYPVWADQLGHQPVQPWSGERTTLPDTHAAMRRWGKRRAGRKLDGQTWDQFPQAAP
jgi:protein gp37